MIIKVCGMTQPENLNNIIRCNPHMIGYNFYRQSVRYLNKALPDLPGGIQSVGVFVNPGIEEIIDKKEKYKLGFAQLHGDETPEFTKLANTHLAVIKVFRIDADFDFRALKNYSFCSYYLFDTYTAAYGGSGSKFDWNILNNLESPVPFLLSGGIGPEDVKGLKTFSHPMYAGVDINSKFETAPGVKNVHDVCAFIKELRS